MRDVLVAGAILLGRFHGSLSDPPTWVFLIAAVLAGIMRSGWVGYLGVAGVGSVVGIWLGFSTNAWRASVGVDIYDAPNAAYTALSCLIVGAIFFLLGRFFRLLFDLVTLPPADGSSPP